MIKCIDCIHCEICDEDSALPPQEFDYCAYFKDKSKFIELPFSKDSYCNFGKELYRVFGVTANGDSDFYVNIYKVDNADEVFTSIPYKAVTFISDKEAKRMWRELNGQI